MTRPGDELFEVFRSHARQLHVEIDDDAIQYLVGCSRHTPGVALNLLRWVQDYAMAKTDEGKISVEVAEAAVRMVKVV